MRPHVPAPQHTAPRLAWHARLRGGWVELLSCTAARAYLVFVAALAVIAFLPALFGWTGSVVQSGSMEPRISPGDVVLTTPLPKSSPLPIGRVITFDVDGELVVHRLVHVTDDNTLVTKGDANPDTDSWTVTRTNITGQGRLLVPYAGLPGFWLRHGNLSAFALWGALTLLAVVITVTTARNGRADDGSDDEDGDGGEGGDGGHPELRAPETTSPRERRHVVSTRLPRIIIGAVAVMVIGTAAPGVAYAQGFFTGQTRATASWTAKSYAPISVGSMAGYAAIGSTSVTDGSFLFHLSTAYGSVATSPGTTISNLTIAGTADRNNSAAARAMASAVAARTALNQRPTTQTLAPTLSGTLGGGVYASTTGSFTVPAGTLTLDAKGDSSARFVFHTSTLTMAEGARVVLANGAKASNVWWIVDSTAALGTNATVFGASTQPVGNYLVNGAASLRGCDLSGRVISFTQGVTLYASTVTPAD